VGTSSDEGPPKPGTNRLGATLGIWGVAGGLAGLVWLGAQDPFIGLPLSHPLNLVLFGLCAAIGLGFTATIWLFRRQK
jgi:hypothetical protein